LFITDFALWDINEDSTTHMRSNQNAVNTKMTDIKKKNAIACVVVNNIECLSHLIIF